MKGIIAIKSLWQWRNHCSMRFQSCTDPFPYCNEIGLDFNVGFKKEKLDLQSLTNGAVIEICQFAKLLSRAERHILYDILEHNFDLGVKSEEQVYEFVSRILLNVKASKKERHSKPMVVYDRFKLPCSNLMKISPNSKKQYSKCHVLLKNVRAAVGCTNDLNHNSSGPVVMETDIIQHSVQSSFQLPEEQTGWHSTEESTRDLFPFCEEIGLVFEVISKPKSKQKLDLTLLTNGVMIEISKFVKSVCGAFRLIIADVLEHNFDIDRKSEKEKMQSTLSMINRVWKKHTIYKKNASFQKAAFSWPKRERYPINEGKTCAKYKGVKKDQDMLNLRSKHSYMCPLEESDLEWLDTEPFSECTKLTKNACSLSLTTFSDYTCESQKREKLNKTLQIQEVDLLPGVMDGNMGIESGVTSAASGQERQVFSGSEESFQTATTSSQLLQTPPNVKNKLKTKANSLAAMKKKKMRMKTMRHLRFARQISPLCKEIGLQLDVKTVVNAKLDLQLLTRGVMFEIHNYAIKKPMSYYYCTLYDVLEHNFDLESQKYRSLDLSLRIASKVKKMAKAHVRDIRKMGAYAKQIFELPFNVNKRKPRKYVLKERALRRTIHGKDVI